MSEKSLPYPVRRATGAAVVHMPQLARVQEERIHFGNQRKYVEADAFTANQVPPEHHTDLQAKLATGARVCSFIVMFLEASYS